MASGSIKCKVNSGSSGGSISGNISSGSAKLPAWDSEVDPYQTCELYPLRDNHNKLLYTWNDANINYNGFYVERIWRILSRSSSLTYNNTWTANQNPTEIFSNIGSNPNCLEITDLESGDLYAEDINTNSYSGYYCFFLIIYHTYGLDENMYWSRWIRAGNESITDIRYGDAPSLTFDSSTGHFHIGKTNGNSYHLLEFYTPTNIVPYGADTGITNDETLTEMFYTSIVNFEETPSYFEVYKAYHTINDRVLNRWAPGRYTVGVTFKNNQNRSVISDAIDSVLSDLNSILNQYNVYFTRSGTSGDMTITVDTEWNLYKIDLPTADYVYGGTWEATTNKDGNITSANIKLACDVFEAHPFSTYETVAYEEIVQSMGAGYDQFGYVYNTLHTNFNYRNKPAEISTKDSNILRLVYSPYLNAGDSHDQVSKKLNLPQGTYRASGSTASTVKTGCGFLYENRPYQVRTFAVFNDGYITPMSNWISITTPSFGSISNLTATDRVNGGATFDWDDVVCATKYEMKCIQHWKYNQYGDSADADFSQSNVQTTYRKITSLHKGKSYVVKVRAYSDFYDKEQYSDWAELLFTTNPSQPQMNLSAYNGIITVNWSLQDSESDYDYIYINLYDSNDNVVQTYTITEGSGSSGSFSYSQVSPGMYKVKAKTYLRDWVTGLNLACLDSAGNEYTLIKSITISDKPDLWYWTEVIKRGIEYGVITSSNPLGFEADGTEFHPVTAEDWDNFTEKINEVGAYMLPAKQYTFSTATRRADIKSYYNQAVNAIRDLGYTGSLSTINSGDELTVGLFEVLQSALNSIINGL